MPPVVEYSERPIKLKIRDLGDVVLIEGTAESLQFLGKILDAQSRARDDGFEIAPNGPATTFSMRRPKRAFTFIE
jgi:hypothetical protein